MPDGATRTPSKSFRLPSDPRKIIDFAKDLATDCRISVGRRSATAQEINTFVETGRPDGIRSAMNFLYFQENRLSAHIYSPSMLNFVVETENEYPKDTLMKLQHASKLLTKNWEHNNTDMLFGEGVAAALRFGCCILKQWCEQGETVGVPKYSRRLIMPWQFGVYREDEEDIFKQPAICETNMLSIPEIWKRIWHLPDADDLLRRIKTHAQPNDVGLEAWGFLNQVFSTSSLQTGTSTPYLPKPGGIINMNPAPNFNLRGPVVGVQTYPFHEIWFWDGDDYTTIQYVEPDILIAPRMRACNLLIGDSQLHPYIVIRPNPIVNNFWGRSEAEDLMELQNWVSETAQDIKHLSSLQVDKVLGFQGTDDITDEMYDQMKDAGYYHVGQGASIQDLTPQFPPHILELMTQLQNTFDKIGGFGNILDGGGEPGVRSGNHAQTLVKTASPTLRDRSLLVERQCAQAADLTFELMKAKDARTYWYDAEKFKETSYTLGGLPDDTMVAVDSHSSSPIFSDDHTQLIFACLKAGVIDPESAIDMLPLPKKDLLKRRLIEKQIAQQQMLAKLEKEDPEAFHKLLGAHGGRK